MAEAPIDAARINARAVLAKMRSKREPLIWTVSQKFPRAPRDVRGPRSDQARRPGANLAWIRLPRQQPKAVIAGEFGRFWPVVACLQRVGRFFSQQVSPDCNAGAFASEISASSPSESSLRSKRRAPDAQPPRDLGHLPAVTTYREADGLGFDVRKRAHVAAAVEQRDGGLVAEAAHRLVWEAALHRSFVDDQNALAHAATSQPCAELGHCRRSGLPRR